MKSDVLTDIDINKLYDTNQLGTATPTSVINTVWYINPLHFGVRGGSEEHRQICWGDIQLKRDLEMNRDYLEYHERKTKIRSGENTTDMRVCVAKIYATAENIDKFPVATSLTCSTNQKDRRPL